MARGYQIASSGSTRSNVRTASWTTANHNHNEPPICSAGCICRKSAARYLLLVESLHPRPDRPLVQPAVSNELGVRSTRLLRCAAMTNPFWSQKSFAFTTLTRGIQRQSGECKVNIASRLGQRYVLQTLGSSARLQRQWPAVHPIGGQTEM